MLEWQQYLFAGHSRGGASVPSVTEAPSFGAISKITKNAAGAWCLGRVVYEEVFRVRRLLLSQIVPAFIEFNAFVPSGNPGSNGFNEGFRGH